MKKPSFIKIQKPEPPPEDKLTVIRDRLRAARDLELEKASLEEKLDQVSKDLQRLKTTELPDLMTEVGLDNLGLEAEGNLPPYDMKIKPFYYANIKNEDETAPQAYAWLIKQGHEDLIKYTFTVLFGRSDHLAAIRFEETLKKLRVAYKRTMGVPWNTLTAFLKEQVEGKKTLPPLNLMNGKIGRVAEIKPRVPVKPKKEKELI